MATSCYTGNCHSIACIADNLQSTLCGACSLAEWVSSGSFTVVCCLSPLVIGRYFCHLLPRSCFEMWLWSYLEFLIEIPIFTTFLRSSGFLAHDLCRLCSVFHFPHYARYSVWHWQFDLTWGLLVATNYYSLFTAGPYFFNSMVIFVKVNNNKCSVALIDWQQW